MSPPSGLRYVHINHVWNRTFHSRIRPRTNIGIAIRNADGEDTVPPVNVDSFAIMQRWWCPPNSRSRRPRCGMHHACHSVETFA